MPSPISERTGNPDFDNRRPSCDSRHARAGTDNIDLKRYPGVAAAYVFKNESGDPVASMDGLARVFAHYLPAIIQAPAETIFQFSSDSVFDSVQISTSFH